MTRKPWKWISKEQQADWLARQVKGCRVCGEEKPWSEFHMLRAMLFGINTVCKGCRKPLSRANYKSRPPEQILWEAAKSRATRHKRKFSIDIDDIVIPAVCPILGVALHKKGSGHQYAPSLDRIDSAKGYVKGNVQVVSRRANTLKNNGTREEFQAILDWMEV